MAVVLSTLPMALLLGAAVRGVTLLLRRVEESGRQFAFYSALSGLPFLVAMALVLVGLPPEQRGVSVAVSLLAAFIPGVFVALLETRQPLMVIVYLAALIAVAGLPVYWTSAQGSWTYGHTYVGAKLTSAPCDAMAETLFAHVSDTHIAESATTADGEAGGQAFVPDLRTPLRRLKPHVLLVTGDITDSGTDKEWRNAATALDNAASGRPVLLVPGNHDMGLQYQSPPEDAPGSVDAYHLQLGRLLSHQPAFAENVTVADGRQLSALVRASEPSATDVGTRVVAIKKACDDSCFLAIDGTRRGAQQAGRCRVGCATTDFRPQATRDLIAEFWQRNTEALFPLRYVAARGALDVFVLNSVPITSSRSVGASAIGGVPASQLNRLATALAGVAPGPRVVVVAMHHPLFRGDAKNPKGPVDWRSARDWFNSEWWAYAFLRNEALNARGVVDALSAFASARSDVRLVLAYGHRHVRRLSTFNGMVVLEAPDIRARVMFVGAWDRETLTIAECPFP